MISLILYLPTMNVFSNQTQLSIMIPIVADKSNKTICLANCKSVEAGIADIHYTHTHTRSTHSVSYSWCATQGQGQGRVVQILDTWYSILALETGTIEGISGGSLTRFDNHLTTARRSGAISRAERRRDRR